MIELPTRRRLERRRDRLYTHLDAIIKIASVSQVESVMRQIHCINLRLRTYFKSDLKRSEPQELFIDRNEDNDITQITATGEVSPTEDEIAQIEQQIKEGKI